MKKLNKITAALASLALAATAFVGCAYNHPDLDPQVDLGSFYLRGNMNNWGNDDIKDGELKANGNGTYSITYTAKAADDEFAIADKGWGTKFCDGKSVSIGGTVVSLPSGGSNAKVTGQIPGNKYKMTIKPSATSVSVKVVLAESTVQTFSVVDSTGKVKTIDYDGTSYIYKFETGASATAVNLTIISKEKGYSGILDGSKEAGKIVAGDSGTVSITNLSPNTKYVLKFTNDGESCATTLKKLSYFIVGAPNYTTENVWSRLDAVDGETDVYKYEFVYAAAMSGNWGSPSDGVAFKITKTSGQWDKCFWGKSLTVGADYVESGTEGDVNASVAGLTAGTTYEVYLKISGETYSVKVVAK